MSDLDPGVPPMIRQGQLVESIARAIAEGTREQWQSLNYSARVLSTFMQDNLTSVRADGATESLWVPRGFPNDLVQELRSVMYRPGSGTWFSMELTITQPGDVDVQFNYTDEPAWKHDISPVHYGDDQKQFPRDEASQPEWLKKQLALAAAQG